MGGGMMKSGLPSEPPIIRRSERYANTANFDACRYERGNGYQRDGYSETAGSTEFQEICGAWREGWQLESVCDIIKEKFNVERT